MKFVRWIYNMVCPRSMFHKTYNITWYRKMTQVFEIALLIILSFCTKIITFGKMRIPISNYNFAYSRTLNINFIDHKVFHTSKSYDTFTTSSCFETSILKRAKWNEMIIVLFGILSRLLPLDNILDVTHFNQWHNNQLLKWE